MNTENPYVPVQVPAASNTPRNDLRLYFAASAVVLLLCGGWIVIQKSYHRLRYEDGTIVIEKQYPPSSNGVRYASAIFIDVPGLIFLITLAVTFTNVLVWLALKVIRYRQQVCNTKLE